MSRKKKTEGDGTDWPNIFAAPTGDDTIDYWIYQPKAQEAAKLGLEDVIRFLESKSGDYIWQNEGIRLFEREKPVEHFYGSTQFDDNMEDEWFIVHLLAQLSTRFPDLILRVNDSDGELILIEAADYLPQWATPKTTVNRVYIKSGLIHLIPRTFVGDVSRAKPIESPHSGAQIVSDFPEETLACDDIQSAIKRRLKGFAEGDRQKENLHRAACTVPPRVAYILEKRPALVAAAVRCFYLKDPFDLKACREMHFFRPDQPDEPLVTRSVTFTKHLYAMLKQQRFFPDRRSGWLFPLDPAEKKAAELGMKLTCGFEILCRRCAKIEDGKVEGTNGAASSRWEKFEESLQRNGYFQGEKKGSQLENCLQEKAQAFFRESVVEGGLNGGLPGLEVLALLKESNSDALMKQIADLKTGAKEDDDSWMNVDPQELNRELDGQLKDMMSKAGTGLNGLDSDADDEEDEKVPNGSSQPLVKELRKKVETFLMEGSGPAEEGAEPVRPKRNRNKRKKAAGKSKVGVKEVPKGDSMGILDLHIPVSGDESSSMDSYGEDDLNIDLTDEAVKEMKEFGEQMREYMKAMDSELGTTSLAKSFPKKLNMRDKSKSPGGDSIDLEDDDFTPVDIDKNLVNNMLQSYQTEQVQGPGPTSSLFATLNIAPNERDILETLDSDDDEPSLECK